MEDIKSCSSFVQVGGERGGGLVEVTMLAHSSLQEISLIARMASIYFRSQVCGARIKSEAEMALSIIGNIADESQNAVDAELECSVGLKDRS